MILSDHEFLPNSSIPLKTRLNHAVFPLTQGTPDLSNIASKAAALAMTQTPQFRDLMQRVITLAKGMAQSLIESGFKLVTGGTDTHMILLDLEANSMTGMEAERLLESVGILANRNLIPGDNRNAMETSGLRLGTNTLALRKFDESGIRELVDILSSVLLIRKSISDSTIRHRVQTLCVSYPLPDTT